MRKMLPYGTRKGKDDEIKLFHGRRGRHLCGKRLEVFVCVRMVSAEASAQEMTALHHSIKKSTKRKAVVSIAIKEYSMSRDSTRQLSPNFKVREFACKGSDVVLLDDELVVLLQCIREHFGKPVYITSGYRTAAHNAAVGASTFWAGRQTSTLRAWTWPRSPPTPRPCCPPGAASGVTRRTPLIPSAAPAGCISIPGRARAGGRCKKTLKLLLPL